MVSDAPISLGQTLDRSIRFRHDRYTSELDSYATDLKTGLAKLGDNSQYTILAKSLLKQLDQPHFTLPYGMCLFLTRLESDGREDFLHAKTHYQEYQKEYGYFEGLLQVVI